MSMIRPLYIVCASICLCVLVSFYGGAIFGWNLRSIPDFDNALPRAAQYVLTLGIVLLLGLLFPAIRSHAWQGKIAKAAVLTIFAYVLIAGLAFASLEYGTI